MSYGTVGGDDAREADLYGGDQKSGGWWIGWIEEVPGVNCQELTSEGLLETLRITLEEALEFNRREVREAAGEGLRGDPDRRMKREGFLRNLRKSR